METAFKIIFFFAVIVFCLVIVGIFLVIIKILFLFNSEINFFGITFMPEQILQ